MLWMYAAAGFTGILCGCFFRVPALMLLSFLSFSSVVFFVVVDNWSIAHSLITAVLLTAVLQVGYLVGAALCHYVRLQPRLRFRDRVNARRDFQDSLSGASQQSLPH